MKQPACGIGPAKKQLDKCPECSTWDFSTKPYLVKRLDEAMATLDELEAGFCKSWEAVVEESPWGNIYDACGEPNMWGMFILWLEERSQEIQKLGDEYEPELLETMLHTIDTIKDMLIEIEAEVGAYAVHWAIRDACYKDRKAMIQQNNKHRIIVESDWQDRGMTHDI